MAGNRIYIQVDFQSQSANQAIVKLNQNIQQIGTSSAKATAESAKGVQGMTLAIEQSGRAINELTAALTGLGLIELGRKAIEAAGNFERLELAFQTMTGSADQAQRVLGQFQELAKGQPFSFDELAEAGRKLGAFGVQTKDLAEDIKIISNAVHAIGGDAGQLERVVETVGRMRAEDVVNVRELRQLENLGLPVLQTVQQAIQKATGRTFSEEQIRDLAQRGQLAGKFFADAFLEGLAKTRDLTGQLNLEQQFTKLADDVKKSREQLAADIGPYIEKLLKYLHDLLESFRSLPEGTRHAIEGIAGVGAAIIVLTPAVKGLIDLFGLLSGAVKGLAGLTLTPLGLLLAGAGAAAAVTAQQLSDLNERYKELGQTQERIRYGKTLEELKKTAVGGKITPELGAGGAPAYATDIGAEIQRVTGKGTPFRIDPAAVKQAADLLARANEQNLKGLAAIETKYAQILKDFRTQFPGTPTTDILKARQVEIDRYYRDSAEKIREARDKVRQQEYADQIEMAKSAAALEVEIAGSAIQETQAKQAAALAEQLRIRIAAAQQVHDLEISKADDLENEAKLRLNEETKRQLDSGKLTAEAMLRYLQQEYQPQLNTIEAEGAAQRAKIDKTYADETAQYRIELQKRVNDEAARDLQETLSTNREAAIGHAQAVGEIARARIDIGRDDTAAKRAAAIQEQAQVEIDTQRKVLELRETFAKQDFDDRMAYLEILKTAGIDVAQAEYDAQLNYTAKLNALNQQEADSEAKMRIDAARQANDAIVEEQQKIYDQLRGAAGRVFDALFQRASNVWSAIGNALKTALLGAFKDIVTSRLAGEMMYLFTGQPVRFESRGGFGTGPFAESGLGKLAAALTAKPVFGGLPQSKLDEFNHLGDLTLTPRGNVPVEIQPGSQPIQSQVNATSRSNININVTGTGAAGLSPQTLLSALAYGGAAAIPQQQQSVVTTTLTFPGEGGPVYTTGGTRGYSGFAGGSLMTGLGPLPGLLYSGGGGGYGGGYAAGGGYVPFTGGSLLGGFAPLPGLLFGGATGAMPGMPAGGLPSLLGQIQKAGGLGSFFRQTQQYYTREVPGPLQPGQAPLTGTFAAESLFNPAASAIAPLTLLGSVLGLQGAFAIGRLGQNQRIPAPLAGVGAAALGAFSGLLAAGSLAALFPSVFVPLLAAGPIGWIVAAGIGAAIGLTGLFKQTDEQHVRQLIRQFYGVDISNMNILSQIVQLAKQQFGGNFSLAVASPQVQEIVNLYAAETGIRALHMPRQMYPATFSQSSVAVGGASAGLQLQPTYMNGQLVASPYTGYTTQQMATAASLFYGNSQSQNFRNALYVQLDPTTAQSLFSGNVINVLNSNPTVVGDVNTTAIANGASRSSQLGGLLEPSTVLA
jgi:tape measure domain-containing protein